MENKTTDDLNTELIKKSNIDSYIKDNQSYFFEQNIGAFLNEFCRKKAIPKASLAKAAGMSEVYLYQLLSGRRNPSRDRLLCLCLGLEATLEEVQTLLRQAGYAQLDPKVKRDAIISHGILHRTDLAAINDKLFDENEKTLC